MNGLSGIDLALLAVAVLIAVATLVRLMRARRDWLIADVRQQVAAERQVRAKKKQDAA